MWSVKSKLKRAWWAVGAVLLLVTGTALLLLVGAKAVLLVEEGKANAEVIVVLGGDRGDRTSRALDLYAAKAAPRILISGFGDCWLIRDRIVRAGVSTNALLMEPNSRNTKENAEFSVRLMRERHMKSAILVTSWYHSRRALACFRSFGTNIEFSSFPAYDGSGTDPKPHSNEVTRVVHEYFALVWYWVRYGIAP